MGTGSYPTDPANVASSAAMYASHPSSYMSAADPAYFGDQEVVIRVVPGGRDYTPADAEQLFKHAGLELAQKMPRTTLASSSFSHRTFRMSTPTLRRAPACRPS
jgi:lecithin-cholesterol acyltransferase